MFGIIVIFFPTIIAYLIWGFILFIGINMFMISRNLNKQKQGEQDYVKFWDYKIYRNKK